MPGAGRSAFESANDPFAYSAASAVSNRDVGTTNDPANGNNSYPSSVSSSISPTDGLVRRPKTTTEFHRKQIAHLMRNAVTTATTSQDGSQTNSPSPPVSPSINSSSEPTSPAPTLNGNREVPPPKEFIRNVQGSSAGAGSGDFHVYRAHRRREYARQRMLEDKARKEKLNEQHQARIDAMRSKDDEVTAKKRRKRHAKKMKSKASKLNGTLAKGDENASEGEAANDEPSNGNAKDAEEGTRNGHHNGAAAGAEDGNGTEIKHEDRPDKDDQVDESRELHKFKRRKTRMNGHSNGVQSEKVTESASTQNGNGAAS